jgi:hypothetical protein
MENLIGIGKLFNPTWKTRLSELRPYLKTGDLILVHGRYPYSWLVELLQWSKWGHVCMVVKREDIPGDTSGMPELMIWESNTLIDDSAKNLWGEVKDFKDGPQLISLEERLNNTSKGEDILIAHKPMHFPLGTDFSKLPDIFDEFIKKGFPPSEAEILASVTLGRWKNRDADNPEKFIDVKVNVFKDDLSVAITNMDDFKTLSSLTDIDKKNIYCSELIAYTLKRLGILSNYHVSNAYMPKDFSNEGNVAFLKNVSLGKQMYLEIDNDDIVNP